MRFQSVRSVSRPMSDGIQRRSALSAGDHKEKAEGWFGSDRPDRLVAGGETIAVARKKALLRILARREADRANIRPNETDIRAMSEKFRQSFGLTDDDTLAKWLAANGLSPENYAAAMRDFTVVHLVEEYFAGEIDDLVQEQVAISTARHRLGKPG
jgi:hypothetical protein